MDPQTSPKQAAMESMLKDRPLLSAPVVYDIPKDSPASRTAKDLFLRSFGRNGDVRLRTSFGYN